MVEGYFNQQRNVRLIIQIIDIRHAPSKDDLQMLEYLSHFQFPFAVVLTKLDKLNKSKAKEQIEYFNTLLSKYEDIKIIPFSSVTGEGTGEIRKTIEEYLES